MATTRRGWKRAADNDQKGAFVSKQSVSQLVSLGLTSSQRWESACSVATNRAFPMDDGVACDMDVNFAAHWMVHNLGDLATSRHSCYLAVQALCQRLQPLTDHLRKFQQVSVQMVSSQVHLGFLEVAVVLLGWPDWRLPLRYVTGFSTLGNWKQQACYARLMSKHP